MANEPSIAPGDSGEYVTLLQERLQRLGYYDGSVDGYYSPDTETAVQRFQEATGLERDGQVQETTWQALDEHEAQYGTQQPTDTSASAGDQSGRQLSEDGQWWWDGTDWQPVDGQQPADTAAAADTAQPETQLSPDGQWQWDGSQWLPVGESTAMLGFALDGPTAEAGPFGTADQLGHSPGLKSESTADALKGFETGLADLLPEHMEILDGIVADLKAHPLNGGFVTLTGGADRRGDPERNKALGQQRAEVVRKYLVDRIDDEETKQEIRAYSLGAPEDGPQGDQPDLRRVDIAITRRTIEMPLPQPSPPLSETPHYKMPEPSPIPGIGPWPTPPQDWMRLPQLPPSKDYITQFNEWIDRDVFNTDDLERLGGDLAGRFGQDRGTVRRKLDEAFRAGKEAAVKALVQLFVDWAKAALSTPNLGPHQGPPDPIPFPDVPQGPTIRF